MENRHRSPILDKHLGEYVTLELRTDYGTIEEVDGILEWNDDDTSFKTNMYFLRRSAPNSSISFRKTHIRACITTKREPVY